MGRKCYGHHSGYGPGKRYGHYRSHGSSRSCYGGHQEGAAAKSFTKKITKTFVTKVKFVPQVKQRYSYVTVDYSRGQGSSYGHGHSYGHSRGHCPCKRKRY